MAEAVLPAEACVPINCFIATDCFRPSLPPGRRVRNYYDMVHGEKRTEFTLAFNNNLLPFLHAFNPYTANVENKMSS